MLPANLVLELLAALVTVEKRVVEGLLHKAVDVLAEVEVAAAVGASLRALSPLGDALLTAELVALLALFRLLHDAGANCAGEVLVEGCNRLLCL